MYAGQVMAKAMEWLHVEAKERWCAASALTQLSGRETALQLLCEEGEEIVRGAWGDFEVSPGAKHNYLSAGHLVRVLWWYMNERDPYQVLPLEESGKVLAERATVFDWPKIGKHGGVELLRVGGKPDVPGIVAGQKALVDWKCTTQPVNRWWSMKFETIGHQLRIYMAMLRHAYGIEAECAYVDGIHIGTRADEGVAYWNRVQSVRSKLFGPFNFTNAQLDETWDWIYGLGKTRGLYERLGVWPQNEGHCGDYGGCEFRLVCGSTPQIRNSIIEQEYVRWEPKGVLVSGADENE